MASKLKITPSIEGMTYIYNVSSHVGDGQACANHYDDVQLVQFLLRQLILKAAASTKIQTLPQPSGVFDVVTAYWIYNVQNASPKFFITDGKISPAKSSATYGEGRFWSIVALNLMYKRANPSEFDKLHLNVALGPSLRSSLSVG